MGDEEVSKVYVIDRTGKELEPTRRNAKVRLLLKSKKAKIVNRDPFTIQLMGKVGEKTCVHPEVRAD